jgi:hypothetical protein
LSTDSYHDEAVSCRRLKRHDSSLGLQPDDLAVTVTVFELWVGLERSGAGRILRWLSLPALIGGGLAGVHRFPAMAASEAAAETRNTRVVAGKSSDYGRLFFQAEVFRAGRLAEPRQRPEETITEPARRVPVFRDCDVLVAGGGPSGTAAAIAAARAGADVVLVERHNHLGGLSSGGLVIWIDRMTGWSGEPVIRGIGEELLDRLPKEAVAGPPRAEWGIADAVTAAYWKERTAAFHGIVTWSPTIDPENLKLLSQEMVLAEGVHLVLHAWAAAPIIEADGRVGGAVFESKEGRLAIRAKVTIDCTGDGDLFHRAGASSDSDIDERDIHHCINTAWLFAGIDMPRWIAFKTGDLEGFKAFMERGREACGGLFERRGLDGCDATPGRDRRLAVAVAEISAGLGALWLPAAARNRRVIGRRASYFLRPVEPFLPARDPAMLADRPGGRRRGGGGDYNGLHST